MIKHPYKTMYKYMLCLLFITLSTTLFAKDYRKKVFASDTASAAFSSTLNFNTFNERLVFTVLSEHIKWNESAVYRESDSAMTNTLTAYWANLGWKVTAKQLQDSLWQENHPWSAAFISWVMKLAGAENHFSYATNHASYIVSARDNTIKNQGIFKAYAIDDSSAAWPQPGDLLCKNRNGNNYTLSNIPGSAISHCDVVTVSDKTNRTVITIGGNVNNRVAKRIVYLNEQGLVDRNIVWCITDDPQQEFTGTQADYFAVIKTLDATNEHNIPGKNVYAR